MDDLVLVNSGSFGYALKLLQSGQCVQRKGWNGKNLKLQLVNPKDSVESLPYIRMIYPSDNEHTPNASVPWLASQTDVLANDWQIVDL